MLTTPYYSNFRLCEFWLSNTKNGILNEEILNLQISIYGKPYKRFQEIKTFIRTRISDVQEEILKDTPNCFVTNKYSMYFSTTTNISDVFYEQNRNVILVTPFMPSFDEVYRPILYVSLKDYSFDLNSRLNKDPLNIELFQNIGKIANKPKLSQYDEDVNYIKKLPLLELMRNKEYDRIGNFVDTLTFKEPYQIMFHKILIGTKYLIRDHCFKLLILDDLKMFVNERVLLVRLSIILYRLAFLKFDKEEIEIEKFFSQKLGFGKFENIYLDNLNFTSRDLTTNTPYEAYDLRYLEQKQIAIAKNIIQNQRMRYGNELDFKFDKESIHEVTHLPYETISKLIQKDLV